MVPASTHHDTSAPVIRSSLSGWLLLAALLVVARTWPYVWWGTLDFDADQAVVGLMAKHLAEFRAFPVYQYALSYVVELTVWLAAPFMWVFGPTIFALKLPLVVLNVLVGMGLVIAIVRAGLRPAIAMLLSLPVLVLGPISNAAVMDALGMTVEPLVFTLALWFLRRRPLALGVVASLAFHVREFAAYAVAALIALDAVPVVAAFVHGAPGDGRREITAAVRPWSHTLMAALATTATIAGLARFSSIRGPASWIDADGGSNLATLGGAFCFAPAQAAANVLALGQSYLGQLWGVAPAPLLDGAVHSSLWQGQAWAWPVVGGAALLALVRLVRHAPTLWAQRDNEALQLAAFLVLVGIQAAGVYAVSRCGPLSLITARYALLALFLPTGLALATWMVRPTDRVQRAVGVLMVVIAGLNGWTHARLWHEQLTTPVQTNRADLGPALEARGIRYIRSDYWTAYYVAFMTQERVKASPDMLSRVDAYEREMAQHADEIVRVSTTRCGPEVVPGFYLCPETP